MARRRSAKVKYVTRLAASPTVDDVDNKIKPVGTEVQLHPDKAVYLQRMNKVYMPGEEPPQRKRTRKGTRRRAPEISEDEVIQPHVEGDDE